MTRTRTAAALLIAAVFAVGVLAGIAADHVWLLRHGPRHGGGRISTSRMADRLARELKLTPEQKTQVTQILDRHRTKIDVLMSNVRPQVRQEVDASNREIDSILTPDQRTKFQEMRKRSEKRRGRM